MLYRKYLNTNHKSPGFGKWYARAVITHTVELNELAREVEANSTFKSSDVKGVLIETGYVIRDLLQEGKRVHLDGLGSFRMAIQTRGAASAKELSLRKHLRRLRVVFLPEGHHEADGSRPREWTEDVSFTELPCFEGPAGRLKNDSY